MTRKIEREFPEYFQSTNIGAATLREPLSQTLKLFQNGHDNLLGIKELIEH